MNYWSPFAAYQVYFLVIGASSETRMPLCGRSVSFLIFFVTRCGQLIFEPSDLHIHSTYREDFSCVYSKVLKTFLAQKSFPENFDIMGFSPKNFECHEHLLGKWYL